MSDETDTRQFSLMYLPACLPSLACLCWRSQCAPLWGVEDAGLCSFMECAARAPYVPQRGIKVSAGTRGASRGRRSGMRGHLRASRQPDALAASVSTVRPRTSVCLIADAGLTISSRSQLARLRVHPVMCLIADARLTISSRSQLAQRREHSFLYLPVPFRASASTRALRARVHPQADRAVQRDERAARVIETANGTRAARARGCVPTPPCPRRRARQRRASQTP
jgi:hypothetical protein